MGPGLRRGIRVDPEFSCRGGCAHGSPDCRPGAGGYHGIGARRVLFYVCVPGRGGVGFDLHTPIYTPDAEDATRAFRARFPYEPMGSVDYHIANPKEGSWLTHIRQACVVTAADDCWCDGTTLQADVGVEALLRGGREGVWSWLAEAWLPDAIEMFGEQ